MYVDQRQVDVRPRRRDGRQIWRTPVELEPEHAGAPINRGAPTIYNGKLFRVTFDNHVLALDMKTGKQVWKQKFADAKEGYYATGAPIVANGVLISGMAGGESTTRGFLDGWDPETGKKLWRRYTIPAPGEPGSETWPKDSDAWMYGGGPTWRSGSYDPELDLRVLGHRQRRALRSAARAARSTACTRRACWRSGRRPVRSPATTSTRPTTCTTWTAPTRTVLADLRIGGRLRKVMIQANKNGFMYVLDRTNCGLIAAHPYVKVNWATHVDLADRPASADGTLQAVSRRRGSRDLAVARHQRRADGVRSAPAGSSTRARGTCRASRRSRQPRPQVIGANSTGVTARVPPVKPGDVLGHFLAINPLTGEKKWEVPLTDFPGAAGMLATGGGLVFTGKLTGEFVALDAATGKTLWQFKTARASTRRRSPTRTRAGNT